MRERIWFRDAQKMINTGLRLYYFTIFTPRVTNTCQATAVGHAQTAKDACPRVFPFGRLIRFLLSATAESPLQGFQRRAWPTRGGTGVDD